MERAERDVRVGVLGREPDRRLEGALDLAAEPLGERLGDADALAVAAERVGHAVPRVRVLRIFGRARLGALGHLHEERLLGLLARLEVGGVDRLRLVGDRHASGRARLRRLQAGLGGLLELARMEQPPGRQHRLVLRQRLGIAGMQARPLLLQRRGVVGVRLGVVREGGPLGHGAGLLRRGCSARRARAGARALRERGRAAAGSARGRRRAAARRRPPRAGAHGAGRARIRSSASR